MNDIGQEFPNYNTNMATVGNLYRQHIKVGWTSQLQPPMNNINKPMNFQNYHTHTQTWFLWQPIKVNTINLIHRQLQDGEDFTVATSHE